MGEKCRFSDSKSSALFHYPTLSSQTCPSLATSAPRFLLALIPGPSFVIPISPPLWTTVLKLDSFPGLLLPETYLFFILSSLLNWVIWKKKKKKRVPSVSLRLIAGYRANLKGIAFILDFERQNIHLRQWFLKIYSLDQHQHHWGAG